MNRALAMLIIGLVFGGGLGFVLAAANGVTLDGHDHATDHQHQTGVAMPHDHGEVLSLDPGPNAPTLQIDVLPDPVAGWNLHLRTTGFTFAPDHAGAAHVPGEGHAHVYANGVKLARIYGDWFHLDKLPAGEVEVEVTLTSNDHRILAVGQTPLSQSVTLTVPSGG